MRRDQLQVPIADMRWSSARGPGLGERATAGDVEDLLRGARGRTETMTVLSLNRPPRDCFPRLHPFLRSTRSETRGQLPAASPARALLSASLRSRRFGTRLRTVVFELRNSVY
jgi:hypothetical protein